MIIIRRTSAVLIGLTFLASGILKLMDPLGAGLLMEEYFRFLHLNFLSFSANVVVSILALFETFVAISLITGVWRKKTAITVLVLTVLYTLLTLIVLIFNPPMDCGCFGEAIKLTHLQSVIKNLVLCGLWVVAFVPFKKMLWPRKIKYLSFSIGCISLSIFFLYSIFSVPIIDYTDYKPGAELSTLETFDWEGSEKMITLPFSDMQGNYADSLVLQGKVIVVSIYNPEKVSAQRWEKLKSFVGTTRESDYNPLILTASTPELIRKTEVPQELMPNIYFADRKLIQTLNRSNGGATFISDGQIITKWSVHSLPGKEELDELAELDPVEAMMSENHVKRLKFQAFLLYVCAVIFLL